MGVKILDNLHDAGEKNIAKQGYKISDFFFAPFLLSLFCLQIIDNPHNFDCEGFGGSCMARVLLVLKFEIKTCT